MSQENKIRAYEAQGKVLLAQGQEHTPCPATINRAREIAASENRKLQPSLGRAAKAAGVKTSKD